MAHVRDHLLLAELPEVEVHVLRRGHVQHAALEAEAHEADQRREAPLECRARRFQRRLQQLREGAAQEGGASPSG